MKLQSFFRHLSSAQGLDNFKKTIPFALFLFFQRSLSVPSYSKTIQTEPSAPPIQTSNEAITVMAYVKAMGRVANVPAKNLIVNSHLLALETVSGNGDNMKLVTVSGDQVMWHMRCSDPLISRG